MYKLLIYRMPFYIMILLILKKSVKAISERIPRSLLRGVSIETPRPFCNFLHYIINLLMSKGLFWKGNPSCLAV